VRSVATERRWREHARKPPGRPVRSEHLEQVQLVARIRQFYPDVVVFAIPNGGLRSKTEAARLKAEGVLAGVPDLFVAESQRGFQGLFVEVKRDGAGRVSGPQRRIHRLLIERGYAVLLADRGLEDAWTEVDSYLRGRLGPRGHSLDARDRGSA